MSDTNTNPLVKHVRDECARIQTVVENDWEHGMKEFGGNYVTMCKAACVVGYIEGFIAAMQISGIITNDEGDSLFDAWCNDNMPKAIVTESSATQPPASA